MANLPKISVCLPNLNMRPYLAERIASIQAQTLPDWELVGFDNYSDDGSWELFQAAAARDSRLRIAQAPRRGMYANWNNCLRAARGEYIYVATSDDTMMPTCLEEMARSLDRHPGCGLAVCRAMAIDASGHEVPNWWPSREGTRFFGAWMERAHIRPAPHDGILHGAIGVVYDSITQVLFRRSLVERIGYFREDYGSIADFEWEMRASLVTDTLFLPRTLATWRVQPTQATQGAMFAQPEIWAKVVRMIGLALEAANRIAPEKNAHLDLALLQHYFACVTYQLCLARSPSFAGKLGCLLRHGRRSSVLRHAAACRSQGRPFTQPDRQVWAATLLRDQRAPALIPL